MPTRQVLLECKDCGRETVHRDRTPDTTLHLVLSIATFGVWLLVWLMLYVFRSRPVCKVCGRRNRRLFGG